MQQELNAGDELVISERFIDAFIKSESRKMKGRRVFVVRTFEVMSRFCDGRMAEILFKAPTKRHKDHFVKFSVSDISRGIVEIIKCSKT